jgi:glycosyltransferase involved in cell wall biosynthesis
LPGGDDIAVVIPALDEAESIAALLDDCAAQDPPPAEVVVTDAGSTDGTFEIARERTASWPALRVLRVDGATPGAGRNAAIRASRSPLIATVDGGSRLGPEWLATISRPLRSGRRDLVAVGVAEPDPRTAFELVSGWLTLGAFKPPGGRRPVGTAYLPGAGHGSCFTREAWERAGGYPEELPWGEDKLFLRRLRGAGLEMVAVPGARIRWRPRRGLAELHRQYRGYGLADALIGLDRRNELVPLGLYATGLALAIAALAGSATAGIALAAVTVAYLSIFLVAAARALGWRPALLWVVPVRVVADAAKIHGFLVGTFARLRRRG